MISDRDVWAAALLMVKRYKVDTSSDALVPWRLRPAPCFWRTPNLTDGQTLTHDPNQLRVSDWLFDRPSSSEGFAHLKIVGMRHSPKRNARRVGRHHDYGHGGIKAAQLSKCFKALLVGHEDVANHEIETPLCELPQAVVAVNREHRVVADIFQHDIDDAARALLVVDDENASHS